MKLTFYMKSGNKIVQRGVAEYNVGNRGNEIISLEVHFAWWAKFTGKLLVKTIDLSQIEAVQAVA